MVEVGDSRRPDGQWFALDDRRVDAALGLDLRIIFQKNLGTVGLAVTVSKQHLAASTGHPRGDVNGRGSLTYPSFL